MVSVSKAIIPVAGLGSRLLPVTKAQPKEMLPVGRKPVVHYIVEELQHAGISQMLLVTGRKKSSIEDYFDPDPELLRRLADGGSNDLAESLGFLDAGATFFYTRQSSPRGNGDAVRLGRDFAGSEPFVVAFGDTIIRSTGSSRLIARMLQVLDAADASCVLAVEEVDPDEAHKYGIVRPTVDHDTWFEIDDLVEKPSPGAAPSSFAIAARYAFTPDLFPAIELTMPGKSGELWLADSIRVLMKQGHRVCCVRLQADERRYDVGNFESYYKAFVDFALADERYGYLLRQYLQQRLA